MARFQIISLIGGGIRGAFITSYLKELEQKLGRNIAESFDLIAGASTGEIIAAGLALGLSAEQMHDLFAAESKCSHLAHHSRRKEYCDSYVRLPIGCSRR